MLAIINRYSGSDEALYLLENDIQGFWETLQRNCPFVIALDVVRQLAMLNLAFNLGLGSLLAFKNTLNALRTGDFEQAAMELMDSKWFHQVGHRAGRVVAMIREGNLPTAYQISGAIQIGL